MTSTATSGSIRFSTAEKTRLRFLAARLRPSCSSEPPSKKKEGAGNAGCTLHPRSRAQCAQKNAHTSIQGSGGNPTFPAQWLYGLLRALLGDRAFLPPSLANDSANLTPASGRRDHTTSPYASAPFVKAHPRPPHPAARFVTIASRPSCRARWIDSNVICRIAKAEYF